jgi:hypothetical protein
MPAYVASPFKPPVQLLVAGTPSYVFGGYDDRSSPTFGYIISDSASSTTGTVTFQVVSGPIPVVGDNVTVRGAANSANFNTSGTVLTVTAEADSAGIQNGVVTITYTISSTTQATLADGGQVECTRVEVGEALVNGASVPVAAPYNNSQTDSKKTISVNVSFPSAPSTVIVTLQGANFDKDSEYADITTVYNSSTATSGTAEVESNYRFYRLKVTAASGGTSPTIIGKIEV